MMPHGRNAVPWQPRCPWELLRECETAFQATKTVVIHGARFSNYATIHFLSQCCRQSLPAFARALPGFSWQSPDISMEKCASPHARPPPEARAASARKCFSPRLPQPHSFTMSTRKRLRVSWHVVLSNYQKTSNRHYVFFMQHIRPEIRASAMPGKVS